MHKLKTDIANIDSNIISQWTKHKALTDKAVEIENHINQKLVVKKKELLLEQAKWSEVVAKVVGHVNVANSLAEDIGERTTMSMNDFETQIDGLEVDTGNKEALMKSCYELLTSSQVDSQIQIATAQESESTALKRLEEWEKKFEVMCGKYEALQKDHLNQQTKLQATSKSPPPPMPKPKAAVDVAPAPKAVPVAAPSPKAAATPVPSTGGEDMELENLLQQIEEDPDPMGHGLALIESPTRKAGASLSSEVDENGDKDGKIKKARMSIQARNPLNGVPAVCTPNGFSALGTPAASVASGPI